MLANFEPVEIEVFATEAEIIRLEAQLCKEAGTARLGILLPLAWYLRQQDTHRALDLADQVEVLLPHAPLGRNEPQRIRARLALLRAEAQWLFAKIDAALILFEQAQQAMRHCSDLRGMFDAHILRSKIAADCGDSVREDMELLLAADLSQQLQDPIRQELANGMLAYSAVLQNLQDGQARWGSYYAQENPLGDGPAHPVRVVCYNDFHGAIASLSGDFGYSASCFIRSHQAALHTGQLRRVMLIANNIGDAFDSLNDHQTALSWMLQGLELARRSGWPGSIGASLTQTAQVMRHLGSYDSAQQMLDEAMHSMQSFTGSRNQSITLEYLAELELDRAHYQHALESFCQLLEQASRLNHTDFYTTAWRGQAQALSKLGYAEEALQAANTALQLAQGLSDAYHQIDALCVLANIHHSHHLPLSVQEDASDLNANTAAPSAQLHFLLRALQIANSIEGYTIPGNLLDAVADAWAEMGEYEQAYKFARQANLSREKTHSQQATNRAIALQIRQQTEHAQAEGEYHRQLAQAEARRAETLQQTSATLSHLSAIGQEITAHLDSAAVFHALNRHVHQLLDVSSFAIYLLDADGRMLSRAYGVEAGLALPAGQISVANADALSARCVRECTEILTDSLPNQQPENVIPGTHFSLSSLFAPLTVGKRILGVMTVQSLQRHAYGEREQLIFRTLCAYGAIALDNAQAYAKLQQAQGQLVAQEKFAALGSLVAGVAHDLNTPIGNSMIMASALQQHCVEVQGQLQEQSLRHAQLESFVAEAQEASVVILRGLNIAAKLVGSFKQVAVDRATAQKRVFDLYQTSHEVIATMMNQIRLTGHEISIDIASGIELNSYPGPYGQVLTNLIQNALLHGFEGRSNGQMRLRARLLSANKVLVEFHDNGNGISAANLKHVFEPFFTTKMGYGGNGLGMSVSYNIVTSLLQGQMSIDSMPGAWTLISIEIPIDASS